VKPGRNSRVSRRYSMTVLLWNVPLMSRVMSMSFRSSPWSLQHPASKNFITVSVCSSHVETLYSCWRKYLVFWRSKSCGRETCLVSHTCFIFDLFNPLCCSMFRSNLFKEPASELGLDVGQIFKRSFQKTIRNNDVQYETSFSTYSTHCIAAYSTMFRSRSQLLSWELVQFMFTSFIV